MHAISTFPISIHATYTAVLWLYAPPSLTAHLTTHTRAAKCRSAGIPLMGITFVAFRLQLTESGHHLSLILSASAFLRALIHPLYIPACLAGADLYLPRPAISLATT